MILDLHALTAVSVYYTTNAVLLLRSLATGSLLIPERAPFHRANLTLSFGLLAEINLRFLAQ